METILAKLRWKEYRIYNYEIRTYYKLNILLDGMI